MKSTVSNDIADHKLYRLYWKIMLEDILAKLGYEPTKENKEILHEFHKRVIAYTTIAGQSQEVVSMFLFQVTVFWATEKGFFIRSSRKQDYNME